MTRRLECEARARSQQESFISVCASARGTAGSSGPAARERKKSRWKLLVAASETAEGWLEWSWELVPGFYIQQELAAATAPQRRLPAARTQLALARAPSFFSLSSSSPGSQTDRHAPDAISSASRTASPRFAAMEDRRWIDGKKATHPTHPRRGGACVQLHRPGWTGLLTLLRRSRWPHLRIHLPETEKVDLSWAVGGQAAAANGAAFPGVRRSPCSAGKVSSDQPRRGQRLIRRFDDVDEPCTFII